MLESLTIRNLALIEEAEVNLTPGLNILSGETGAGKSILIGSVLLALGGKSSRDLIRRGESEAYCELCFYFPVGSPAREKLQSMDFSLPDDRLIVSRRITETRSICRVNGETVPAARVAEIAPLLIDIYGQREHQSLLKESRQLELVDRFGKEASTPLLSAVSDKYRLFHDLRRELAHATVDEAVRLRNMDILRYEIDEISGADITPGEEKKLADEWKRLTSMEQIRTLLGQITGLVGSEGGASDLAGQAVSSMQGLLRLDPSFRDDAEQLSDAAAILDDIARNMERSLDRADGDDGRADQISERLDTIRRLMQKYGRDESGLLALCEEKQAEMERYEHLDEVKKKLRERTSAAWHALEAEAARLSQLRSEAAARLAAQLEDALRELNFLDVRFSIELTQTKEIRPTGRDEVRFMIAFNPGEELKPLVQVASGGELSRVMLAIKSVFAREEETGTLIFDEIDTGISGRTAQTVSHRLKGLAKTSQVICISHLPQIVSAADTHFLIEKDAVDNRTSTHIRRLSDEDSIRELARLLGGSEITSAVLENAAEMKRLANGWKG